MKYWKNLDWKNRVKFIAKIISAVMAIAIIVLGVYETIKYNDIDKNRATFAMLAILLVTSLLKNPPRVVNIILDVNFGIGFLIQLADYDSLEIDWTFWLAVLCVGIISIGGYLKLYEKGK